MGDTIDDRKEGAAGATAVPHLAPDELAFPFDFERKRRSLRSSEAARPGVETLLARLAVSQPRQALRSDPAFERQLLLFGTEVLLNIEYYGAKTVREERKQWAMNAGIYGLALGFVGFAIYLFVDDRSAAVAASSQLAAVVGAVLAGVKFLTESQDFQKTRCSFWQAGAELKERLYLFIGDWCGKAWDAERSTFTPEFMIALQIEVKKARDVQTDERRRFYELMATPTRLLGATQQLSGDAQSAVSTFLQASQQRDEQRRQQELEQLAKARDGLLQMYPDDGRRPAAVVSRLAELHTRMRILAGETTLTTSVTSAIATAASTSSAGGNVDVVGAGVGVLGGGGGGGGGGGAPFDGRREP